MAWSSWNTKTSSKNGDGSCYELYYRTNPYSSEGKAQLQYYVKVKETGSTYSERWNCVVELKIDSTTYKGSSHTVDYVGNSTDAKKYSTTDKSGYYEGWVCVGDSKTAAESKAILTKNIATSGTNKGKAVWTISLAGGFRDSSSRACKIETFTVSANGYTNVGNGTVTIQDNLNNTFSISGTKGSDGINNTAKAQTFSWGYTENYNTASSNPNILTIKTPSEPTRTVYARGVTPPGNSIGKAGIAETSLPIKQYVAPNKPTGLELKKTKNRLTIKEDWTCKWDPVKGTNESSSVAGYRVKFYVNNGTTNRAVQMKDSSGAVLGTSNAQGVYYYDVEGTSFTFSPSKTGIKAGNKVYFTVEAFSKNGKGQSLWTVGSNTWTLFSGESKLTEIEVQNAGIVHIKDRDGWHEGQVWVKDSTGWHEAETVYTKVGDKWKESI